MCQSRGGLDFKSSMWHKKVNWLLLASQSCAKRQANTFLLAVGELGLPSPLLSWLSPEHPTEAGCCEALELSPGLQRVVKQVAKDQLPPPLQLYFHQISSTQVYTTGCTSDPLLSSHNGSDWRGP